MSKLITWEDYSLFQNCSKSFYLRKFQEEQKERSITGVEDQYRKEKQILRQLMMHNLYPNGTDTGFKELEINEESLKRAATKTLELLEDGVDIIYNAVFFHEGYYAFSDIVDRSAGAMNCILLKPEYPEVSTNIYKMLKSGSNNQDGRRLMADCAYLKSVAARMGYKNKITLCMVNPYYERGAKLELKKYLEFNDVEKVIMKHMQQVGENFDIINSWFNEEISEPDVIVGPHCKRPTCPFYKYCWKNIKDDSIVHIPRITDKKKKIFLNEGSESIFDLDLDHKELTDNQSVNIAKIQRGRERGEAFIKKVRLKMMLNRLNFPLYHLDFETYSPMIPPFPKTKAFDVIPYQFSLHIEHEDGTIEHEEFLNIENEDPRPAFVTNLIQKVANREGNVVVYNRNFEAGVMMNMARLYPQAYDSMENIVERIFDLMEPFKNKFFFDYRMYFSYSLKAVLPALVPGLTHGDMEVSDGLEAMGQYFYMLELDDEIKKLEDDPEQGDLLADKILEKEKIIDDLLKYCKLDTYAMVKILEVLIKGEADLSDWDK